MAGARKGGCEATYRLLERAGDGGCDVSYRADTLEPTNCTAARMVGLRLSGQEGSSTVNTIAYASDDAHGERAPQYGL